MSDARSVMKEFRFLDQKRRTEGLTADEEVRFGELRDLIGTDSSGSSPRPGFDVNAAAARLRESLLPAGLRNRPPPEPEPSPEPMGEIEPPPEPTPPETAAYEEQPAAPAEEAQAGDSFFDPGSLAADAYDQNAAAYDPNAAAYDPNAAAYDPNAAAYDPNAAAYDPNAAAYDPNAAAYDPNAAAYDPSAAAYDPNAAAYDPNATAYDPNAAAFDPGAGVEPASFESTDAGLEPTATQHDDADWSSVAGDVAAGSYLDPHAGQEHTDGDGLPIEAAESLLDQADAPAPLPGEGEDLAWAPQPGGDYDEASWNGGVAAPPAEPFGPADDGAAWSEGQPEAAAPVEFGNYDEAGSAPPADLESLLPFDPAAASAIGPDVLQAFGGPGGELDATGLDRTEPGDLLEENGFHAAASLATDQAPTWQPESGAVDQGFQLASGGSFDAAADAAAPEWATGTGGPMPWEEPAAGGSEAADAGLAAESSAPVEAAGPLDLDVPFEDDVPTLEAEELIEEVPAEALEAAPAVEPPPPAPPAPVPPRAAAPPPAAVEPLEPAEAEVLAPTEAGRVIPGSRRVVVHTLEGLVKRGVVQDVDLDANELPLITSPGAGPEVISTEHVKAVFFMLAPGEKPPAPEGAKVRVTFRDGRQVAGFSPDYQENTFGFFMIPADARTSTERIWVYRSAVKQVSVS